MPVPQRVQYPADIEPLVQFIEETPPGEILDRALEKLRAGVSIPTMLMASALPSASHSSAQGSCRTFVETGKMVCDVFLTYWNTRGGLAQQGYPISDELPEVRPAAN